MNIIIDARNNWTPDRCTARCQYRAPSHTPPHSYIWSLLMLPHSCLSLSPPHPRCVSDALSSSLRECVRRFCNPHSCFVSALDKLGSRHLFINSIPEPVRPNAAFDIASLVLYGCQALPIRLKILLDRLFSALHRDQVIQVLHGFGWTQEDYARGYILQVSAAK